MQVDQVVFVFPPPFSPPVDANTPSTAIIDVRIRKPVGVPGLLVECYTLALNEATREVSALWLRSGYEIVYETLQVTLRYGTLHQGTVYFPFAQALQIFNNLIEVIHSWDEEEFNNARVVTFSFSFHFRRILAPPIGRVTRARVAANVNRLNAGRNLRNVQPKQQRLNGRNLQLGKLTYEQIKGKRIHKRGVEDFFTYTDAIIDTPHTQDNFCFPMAFIKCQMRWYKDIPDPDNPGQTILHIGESKPHAKANWSSMGEMIADPKCWLEPGDLFDPIDFEEFYHQKGEMSNVRSNCTSPMFKNMKEYSTVLVHLFNPYKEKSGDIYVNDNGGPSSELWYMLAMGVQQQVNTFADWGLDWTNEEEIAQAYSNFFSVHIHFYELVGEAYRIKTYIPIPYKEIHRHVHILKENSHCYPVTHVRHFFARTTGSMELSIHNFCDFCGYTTCSSTNRTKALEHITDCRKNNHDCRVHHMSQFEKKNADDVVKAAVNMTTVYSHFCVDCQKDIKVKPRPVTCLEHTVHKVRTRTCCTCLREVSDEDAPTHLCYMPTPKIPIPLEDSAIWVYDVEAEQTQIGELIQGDRKVPRNVFRHRSNEVRVQQVYTGLKMRFDDTDAFCAHICSDPLFDGAVFLAHNGGGYDHQYILQYAEERAIPYSTIPHPSSTTKFLELRLNLSDQLKPRFFKDFMAFVAGSLKSIGKDYGLAVTKGDFPHMFNTIENQGYVGPIPPLLSEEDYFGYLTKRSVKEQQELLEWYTKECETTCCCEGRVCLGCGKKPWDMHYELGKYCELDVEVLAQCVKRYRTTVMTPGEEVCFGWRYPGIDPFTLVTQGQVAIKCLLNGFVEPKHIFSSQYNIRGGYNEKSNEWLRRVMVEDYRGQYPIHYRGTQLREWYFADMDCYLCGFCEGTNTAFLFHDCEYEWCPTCDVNRTWEERPDVLHPKRKQTFKEIHHQRNVLIQKLRNKGYLIEELWEHDLYLGIPETQRHPEHRQVMYDRSYFVGGRTEAFSLYAKPSDTIAMNDDDVVSMYPYNCTQPVRTGAPVLIHGGDLSRLDVNHPDAYNGIVLCRVIPNKRDILGLLPSKDKASGGRLQYTLYDQTGAWDTVTIYFAQKHGYVFTDIYQVYHWPDYCIDKEFFKGYIAYFFRVKQECEGWEKAGCADENPTEEEKDAVIEALYESNGRLARMRKEMVEKSPVRRQVAKIFLNCIWGKFAQDAPQTSFIKLNGYNQWLQFRANRQVDHDTIKVRFIKGNLFKVEYKRKEGLRNNNRYYNIFVASHITALSQVMLHARMMEVGPENVLYCDTDSVYFLNPRQGPNRIEGSQGLGNWSRDHDGVEVTEGYFVAPKTYCLRFEDGKSALKMKGLTATLANKSLVTFEKLGKMVEAMAFQRKAPDPLYLDHMNIAPNSHYTEIPFATLMTLHSKKVFRPVISKRQVVPFEGDHLKLENLDRIYTVPFGYEVPVQELGKRILEADRSDGMSLKYQRL